MRKRVGDDSRGAMYERFFGFRDQPFRLTPDPKYLYLGSKHREGYAHLLYALREGSGFVAVTGEVGTGKTTLVRSLLRENHDDVAVAYIFNPVLSSVELLQTINAEFGLPSRSTSKKELIETLNAFLLAQKSDDGRAVIIVDEAQDLDPSVLEQLRLLSNLETETDKLLQIILLGQPELRGLLDRTDLRQLAQRISLRWHLEPLDRTEVHAYVRHRVQVAGGPDGVFDVKAMDLIYELSGGVPRIVNILAHRSLLVAYTKGAKHVGPAEVNLAAVELEQCRIPLRARKNRPGAWVYKAAAGVSVAAAACVVAFLLVAPLGDDGHTAAKGDEIARLHGKSAAKKDAPENTEKNAEKKQAGAEKRSSSVPAEARASSGSAKTDGEQKSARGADEAAMRGKEHATAVAVAPLPGTQGPAAEGKKSKKAVSRDEGGAVEKATSKQARERLERRLERTDRYEAAAGAMSRLIELWTGHALTPVELSSGSLDLQLLGARRGLRYLSVSLTPKQLQSLDLPAIVELRAGASQDARYALIESMDADDVNLYTDKSFRAPLGALEQLWTGNVHILWRDSERLSRPLSKGARGPAVEKLQSLLAEAGYLKGPATGQYDDATEQAVRRLQAERGLKENGDATTLTQIILYNAIRRYERPDLVGAATEPRVAKTVS